MILLTLIAIATGIALLLVFRRFSDQRAVALDKRQIWAQLYALRLYADEPSVIWPVLGRLFAWNARYLIHMLRPVAVSILPLSVLLFLLDGLYAHRPLESGETALVSTHHQPNPPTLAGVGISVETPALRIPRADLIYWRIRATRTRGSLIFGSHRETVHAGPHLAYISGCPTCFGNILVVHYPRAYLEGFGYQISWLIWFLTITALTMLIFRKHYSVIF